MIVGIGVIYQCICKKCAKRFRINEEFKNIDKNKIIIEGGKCSDRRFTFCSVKCWKELS